MEIFTKFIFAYSLINVTLRLLVILFSRYPRTITYQEPGWDVASVIMSGSIMMWSIYLIWG